jgi:putative membrane protein
MNGMKLTKGTTVALAMFAVAALGACKGSDRYANDSARAANDSAAGRVDTTNRADSLAARTDTAVAATGGWSTASILGYATAANMAEINEAKVAEKKATNAQVKAFARQMVTDHEAMLKDAKSLATKLNAQADTANGDAKDLLKDANDELKELTDKAAGADWDKEFIEKEVDGHQHVLDKLQDAAKNTTDPDLRAALEKATGKVQQHLTKAQDIQAKLK